MFLKEILQDCWPTDEDRCLSESVYYLDCFYNEYPTDGPYDGQELKTYALLYSDMAFAYGRIHRYYETACQVHEIAIVQSLLMILRTFISNYLYLCREGRSKLERKQCLAMATIFEYWLTRINRVDTNSYEAHRYLCVQIAKSANLFN